MTKMILLKLVPHDSNYYPISIRIFFLILIGIFIFHDIKQFKMILEVLTFKRPPIRKEGEKKNVQEAQAWVVFENVSSITNAIKNI